MNEQEPQPPVVDRLEPFVWSSDEALAYEAAIEAINRAVGAYTGLIAKEQTQPSPDQGALERWRSARRACHADRVALRADDTEAVARTRMEYAQLVERIGSTQ